MLTVKASLLSDQKSVARPVCLLCGGFLWPKDCKAKRQECAQIKKKKMGIKLWGTQISTPVLSCACLLLFLIVFQVFLEYFDDEDVVHYHYYGPTTSRSAAAAGATTGGGGGGGMTARAAGMRPGYESKAGIHAHQGGAGSSPFLSSLLSSHPLHQKCSPPPK